MMDSDVKVSPADAAGTAGTIEERLASLESRFRRPQLTSGQEATQSFVSLVNPKFKSYTKPLTLAMLVGAFTFVLCLGVLIAEVTSTSDSKVCTTTTTYPQYFGSAQTQGSFMEQQKMGEVECSEDSPCESDDGLSEYYQSISVDFCLFKEVKILIMQPERDTSFQYNLAAGAYTPHHENCLIPSELMAGHWYTCDDAAGYSWDTSEVVWEGLEFCDDLYDTYDVYVTAAGSGIQGVANIEAYGEGVYCPPVMLDCAQVPWVMDYRQTSQLCTHTKTRQSPTGALGIALAYAAALEFAVTAVVITVLKGIGIVKRKNELVFETV